MEGGADAEAEAEDGAWAAAAGPQSTWARCVGWEPCPIGALPAHLSTPL